jgi:uncharacterized protein (DUF983 family)
MENKKTELTFWRVLLRGFKKKCPRCGEGDLFVMLGTFREKCAVCAFNFEERAGDCWAFFYITTAALTGILIVIMFFIRPTEIWLGQMGIGLAAIVLILLTVPMRKGLALAIDYWFFPNKDARPPEN